MVASLGGRATRFFRSGCVISLTLRCFGSRTNANSCKSMAPTDIAVGQVHTLAGVRRASFARHMFRGNRSLELANNVVRMLNDEWGRLKIQCSEEKMSGESSASTTVLRDRDPEEKSTPSTRIKINLHARLDYRYDGAVQ